MGHSYQWLSFYFNKSKNDIGRNYVYFSIHPRVPPFSIVFNALHAHWSGHGMPTFIVRCAQEFVNRMKRRKIWTSILFCPIPFLYVHFCLCQTLLQLTACFSLVSSTVSVCFFTLILLVGNIIFVVARCLCVDIFPFHDLEHYRCLQLVCMQIGNVKFIYFNTQKFPLHTYISC